MDVFFKGLISLENYRLIRRIGVGAMGDVYEVEHKKLGVRYALKTFKLRDGELDFLRSRFLAEGRTLARIHHSNIARVFDSGVLSDGTVYFVMDLVLAPDGEPRTLADVAPDDFCDANRIAWLLSLASALDAVHAEGIVHRDVKLTNILLSAKNDVVLVDFGISRYVSGAIKREIGVERTVVVGEKEEDKKILMGTGGYLAPEILNGEEASAASDVYALGVVFFKLLTGIWYQPGADVLRLLEPLEGPWREILPPMLDADPRKRPARLVEFVEKAQSDEIRQRRIKMTRRAVIAALSASIGVSVFCFLTNRFLWHEKGSTSSVYDLGGGVLLEMIECRSPQERTFWIGSTHITNTQWNRVTGHNRDDDDDVPVTKMSISEIHAFIAWLNRRFAYRLPKGMSFRLPTEKELIIASTAGGANAADESVLGVFGPSSADKKKYIEDLGIIWDNVMAKLPCRVKTKKPNAWGIYDIVGQGRTICGETLISSKDGKTFHLQLGPDSIYDRSTVGEWGWNSTLRLAIGGS
jgi:serine/threonine protein kinase